MEQFTINKIKFDSSLSDPKTYNDIELIVEMARSSGSAGDSYKILQDLQKVVSKNQASLGDFKEKYDELMLHLKFSSFALLADAEVDEILKKKLLVAYKLGVDLKKIVSLSFVPFFDKNDFTILARLLRSIENNNELLGINNITLPDGSQVVPWIANWFKDYKAKVTEDKGNFGVITYISGNPNTKKLSAEEQDTLKFVLSFYDWLRFGASKTSYLIEDQAIAEKTIQTPPPPARSFESTPRPPATPREDSKSNFDQKLAAVSAPSHGQDLEALRKKMEQNKVSFEPKASTTSTIRMTPEEIKRETNTPELPSAKAQEPPKFTPPAPKPIPPPLRVEEEVEVLRRRTTPKPMPKIPRSMAMSSLNEIKIIDDLKKVEVGHLRQGPINSQLELIKTKILTLARANKILPYYVVIVFEQSSLFRNYLRIGGLLIGDEGTDRAEAFTSAVSNSGIDMTLAEFEAIADLRKEIERL